MGPSQSKTLILKKHFGPIPQLSPYAPRMPVPRWPTIISLAVSKIFFKCSWRLQLKQRLYSKSMGFPWNESTLMVDVQYLSISMLTGWYSSKNDHPRKTTLDIAWSRVVFFGAWNHNVFTTCLDWSWICPVRDLIKNEKKLQERFLTWCWIYHWKIFNKKISTQKLCSRSVSSIDSTFSWIPMIQKFQCDFRRSFPFMW